MPRAPKEPQAAAPKKEPKAAGAAKLEAIKKKYRLNAEVNLYAKGANGMRLGPGPVLDSQVFNKFAELDNTKNKQYLDWMLFQSGGGAERFKHSRDLWGDGTPEKTPDEFFNSFKEEKPETTIQYDELRIIGQKLKDKGVDVPNLMQISDQVASATAHPDLQARFKALTAVLKRNGIAPGKEEALARDMISNKFKSWIKNQLSTKVRDRVHATFVYNRMLRGMSREEAETKWKETEPKRRHEYVFGDQDSQKWDSFAFSRHWPGRESIYEKVYNEMKLFLANKERLERYNEKLEAYNAKVAEKNKTLAPEEQIPGREMFKIDMEIGKVAVDKHGNIAYKGSYPTLQSLATVNKEITDLPMRERISRDVSYAGPKGTRSNKSKIYSDQNIDVVVPLTVAASIQSGHPTWPISNPNQLSDVRADGSYSLSPWSNYAAGKHGHMEWEMGKTQAIPVFFIPKNDVAAAIPKFMVTVFLDDLVDLQPPYVATIWKVGPDEQKHKFSEIIKMLRHHLKKEVYLSTVRSIASAMKILREWGKEFNPQDIIGDYVKHHREKLQGKRTIGEEIKIRATQIVAALLE